jgi:hypothetical protein
VMSAEATYWITEYVLVTLKLKIMPSSNVIWDTIRSCLSKTSRTW